MSSTRIQVPESERRAFLERQKSLLESCYRGESPRDATVQEKMLVELVQHDHEKNSGLQSYLRNMMLVMDFDARRRGRLISQVELNEYTHWLASAVTEAMHYFIGHDGFAPRDETRYLAVSAAHITHMLRDTFDDVQAGYYNIPREVLEAQSHRAAGCAQRCVSRLGEEPGAAGARVFQGRQRLSRRGSRTRAAAWQALPIPHASNGCWTRLKGKAISCALNTVKEKASELDCE